MEYLSPASFRSTLQQPTVLALAGLLALGVLCLVFLDLAAADVALMTVALGIGWIAAATTITHLCGARGLVLKPPQMRADFHQLLGFRVEVGIGNQHARTPSLFVSVRLDTRSEGIALPSPPILVTELATRAHAELAWDITVCKRGEVELLGARVQSCFPGSLFAHECYFPFSYRLLALPASFRLDNRALGLLTGHRRVGARSAATPASMGDYVGVRDYRPGDNPRNIHVGLSARLPDFPYQLVVREFEDPTNDDFYVVLDTYLPESEDDESDWRHKHEISLSFVAAFCRLLVDRRYQVRFCAIDGGNGAIDQGFTLPIRDLPSLEAKLARLRPTNDEAAVVRLLDEVASRGNEAIFFVRLRKGRLPRRWTGLQTIEPAMQASLVREVAGV
jgi:uncharacterized protein (DUF58 family)